MMVGIPLDSRYVEGCVQEHGTKGLDAADYTGKPVLHRICERRLDKDLQELFQKVIDAGADIEVKGKGMPPLCYACVHGNVGAVELLVKAGADVNGQASRGKHEGKAALRIAVDLGHEEIALTPMFG